MIEVELSVWAVHIYCNGQYLRTAEKTFNANGAALFCKVFNEMGSEFLAIANELVTRIQVDERISMCQHDAESL